MKLHLIGNAHLDPVWLWDWTEGYHEAKATFRSALDRMKEFPDFVFTCSAVAYYAWLEADEPDMFAEIRQRVQEGRWVLAGGWWVQPDCNVPCGESFARHALISQSYFETRFGKRATFGYNVDSFGHNGSLPKILRMSGMNDYVFMRPMKHEKELSSNIFQWKSQDGSAVNAFRIPRAYCCQPKELTEHIAVSKAEMPQDSPIGMAFYGVGNHGGGPTIENIQQIHAMRNTKDVEMSSPDKFFAELRKLDMPLPTVEGDLLHHASGCYSAHSGVKMWNRRAENALLSAEKWNTVANLLFNKPYPSEKLDTAWKRVLFNQFHDILSGTSLEEGYEDARNQFGEALSIAQDIGNAAMQTLSWRIRIPMDADTYPIVVFNPHPFDAVLPYAVRIRRNGNVHLTDENGAEIPCQTVLNTTVAIGACKLLLFEASVPAMGYRLLRYRVCEDAPVLPKQDDFVLENALIRAEISPETGLLTSLRYKSEECLAQPSSEGIVIRDTSDTWSHGVFSFPDVEGKFRLESIVRTESGNVRSCITARFTDGESKLEQKYTLWQSANALEIGVTVDWHGHSKMLKLAYAPNGDLQNTTAEIPFGTAQRPADGIEYPMQTWVRMGKLSIINSGKYSYSAKDGVLGLTVLRSPRYAHHNPYVPQESDDHRWMDQGEQRFTLWLRPDDTSDSDNTRLGQMLNTLAYALLETFHAGQLPPTQGYLRVEGAICTAMKQAQDSSGDVILHLYEADGKNSAAKIKLMGREYTAELAPWQVVALRIHDGMAQRINFLEENI